MPERSNGAVSKTVDPGNRVRGFESLSLRQKQEMKDSCFFTFTPIDEYAPKRTIARKNERTKER